MITFDEVINGKANIIYCPIPNAAGEIIPAQLKHVRPTLLRAVTSSPTYADQVWLWGKGGFPRHFLNAPAAIAMMACYTRWVALFLMSPHPAFAKAALIESAKVSGPPSLYWSHSSYQLNADMIDGSYASPYTLLWEIVGKKWAFTKREELIDALGGAERYDWKEKVWKKAKEIGHYHPGHPERITNVRRKAYREKVLSITV